MLERRVSEKKVAIQHTLILSILKPNLILISISEYSEKDREVSFNQILSIRIRS